MEAKSTPIFLSFLFLSLSLSQAFQFHTFIPTSLPNPQPLTFTEPNSQPLTTNAHFLPNDDTTLSLQLHHLDSLSSSSSPQTLFNLRLHRDITRAKTLSSLVTAVSRNNNNTDFSSSIISGLSQGSGEYFTRLGFGTPPKYSYMVLDTGSDVIWIQCSPCRKCYTQSDPIFDPSKSSSFQNITCRSPLCNSLDSPGCNSKNNCMYQVSYGDGSFTFGEFSTETLSFRNNRVQNVAFGCGNDNEGLFAGASGLLGLGRGKLSFPNQAGSKFGSKFSYCLVDRSSSSKPSSLVFGYTAVSKRSVFTPLLSNPKLNTFYYIGLNGFSVGGTRVAGITSSLFQLDSTGNGGVIIDSGTSVTRLTRQAYIALRDAFRAGASTLKRAPNFSLFDTCFDLTGKTEVKVPTVVVHFTGADVSLPASNYLIPVDNNGSFCFAFAGTTSGLSIIGNIQQQGFRVSYDLAASRVGFAPRGCI